MDKHQNGQYFTTNYKHILQNMSVPKDVKTIIEPFCGNGDLLNFIKKSKYTLECYDIDVKHAYITKRDTLQNPPDYKNKFILTNPPYLARNKSINKDIFNKYKTNDLYKCFIKEIIKNPSLGGIIIIPLNFISSIRLADVQLRKAFLSVYDILHINIFEEQVFDDTTYTICSLQFALKTKNDVIDVVVYPSKITLSVTLNNENNYMIGGDIYKLKTKGNYKITRLTHKNVKHKNTNILVKCIDDDKKKQISLTYVSDDDIYVDNTPKLSSRTYATLIITPTIDIDKQKKIVEMFNTYLTNERVKYNSLFLTNYRESKDIARKRISFDLVYKIVEYCLDNYNFLLYNVKIQNIS